MTTTDLALVETPTGPSTPPTQPTSDPGKTVDTVGALTTLTVAISGIAYNASQGGDLVGYPIGASFAAMAIGAVVLYRSPNGGLR
jgi:hypothetical protein